MMTDNTYSSAPARQRPRTAARIGKWAFALPMAVFGVLHFGPPQYTLPWVPDWLPFPLFWVYLSGAGLVLFTVAAVLGRKDRLAAYLLALELLLIVVVTHIPRMLGGDFAELISTFRGISMAGAAILYAEFAARDRSLYPFGPKRTGHA